MDGTQRYPQTRGPLGHRGRANRGDQYAALTQRSRERQGSFTAADHNRLDRRWAVHQLQPQRVDACAKAAYQCRKVLPAPALFTQQMQAGKRGMGNGRRLAGGIDVGPGKLDQGFDQLLAAGDKGPCRAKCLAESAHQHRHLLHGQAIVLDDAAPLITQATKAMGVINHDPGPGTARRGAHSRQVSQIAIHAEHAVGNHQRIALSLAQPTAQAVCVVVQVARETRTGKQPCIKQRGVIKAVLQDGVALPHQRGHCSHIGHVAARQQQRARPASELGQRLFQLMVGAAVTGNQVRRAAASAPALYTLDKGVVDARVVGQPEVVVAAKTQQALAIHQHLDALRRLQQRTLTV